MSDTTLQEGWLYHTNWLTNKEVDFDSVQIYQFGLISQDKRMNMQGSLDVQYTEIEIYNQYYPTVHIGNFPADNISTRYGMVNGLVLYWIMGKAFEITSLTVADATNFTVADVVTGGTSTATGVILSISGTTIRIKVTSGTFQNSETLTSTPGGGNSTVNSEPVYDGVYITYFDGSARKPRIAVWENSNGDKHNYYGVTPESLVIEFVNGFLYSGMQSKGMKHEVSTDTPTFTFPGGIVSAYTNIIQAQWHNTSLKLTQFRLNIGTTLSPIWDADNGYYRDINEFKPVLATMNLQMQSDQATNILPDFHSHTKRTFSFYIYKSDVGDTDKYIKMNMNAYIVHEDHERDTGEPVTYNMVLEIETMYFEIKDGLSKTFYQLS
jgi:hypothetical protein